MRQILLNGSTLKYGIIGNPVSHSFSPSMHSSAFAEIGYNAIYLPFLVEPDQLASLLPAFVLTGVRGLNVTVPYKEKIIPFLDILSDEAKALGSVNTLWYDRGRWHGHSTDGAGLVRGLTQKGWEIKNQRILVLGAGGSAKAITYALLKAGATKVDIDNRTIEKAESLAKSLARSFDPQLIGVGRSGNYDILINCTSVGLKGNQTPLAKEELEKFDKVVDIIYNPAKTKLLQDAESLGIPAENGLSMLLYQGVESFELWTGQPAPVDVMAQVLQQQLQSPT